MKYYSLLFVGDKNYSFISDINFDFNVIDYVDIFKRIKLSSTYCNNFELIIKADKLWPDFICSPVCWPIFSNRFFEIIKFNNDEDFQILPITMSAKKQPYRYYLLNCLKDYDCIDIFNSEIDDYPETEYSKNHEVIMELALKKELIPKEIKVFRVHGDLTRLIFREDLVKEILSHKLQGFHFEEVTVSINE
jgi:hypothetical protein